MYKSNKRYGGLSISVDNIDTQITQTELKYNNKNGYNDVWGKDNVDIHDILRTLYKYINVIYGKKMYIDILYHINVKKIGNNAFFYNNQINCEITPILNSVLIDIGNGKLKRNSRICKGLLTNNYIYYYKDVVVKLITFKRNMGNYACKAGDHTIQTVINNFVKEILNPYIVYNNYTTNYLGYNVVVPKIISFGVHNDPEFPMKTILYIIMERVYGNTLAFIENTYTDVPGDIYKAINYSTGILNKDTIFHNDLNKGNIMIDKLGHIYLIDWGESTIGGDIGIGDYISY